MSLVIRHIRGSGRTKKLLTGLLIGMASVLMITNSALAQEGKGVISAAKPSNPSNGLLLNVASDNQNFASNSIDFPLDNKGVKLFNFDLYDNSCLSGDTNCVSGMTD